MLQLPVAASPRPNILFIAVDDLRNELGCYGAQGVHSPHIDQLAASGTRFNRAYCQQAVCNPSRVSVMTGLRPDSTQVWDLVTNFRDHIPEARTIPQHFRQHGYQAVAFGKIFHNTFPDDVSWNEPTHKPRGVTTYSPEGLERLASYRERMREQGRSEAAIQRMRGPATGILDVEDSDTHDGRITRDALIRMKDLASSERPFFLAVGFIRPHLPFQVPRPYWNLYQRSDIQLAPNPFLPAHAPDIAFGDRSLGGFYELRAYLDHAQAPSPWDKALDEADQLHLKHGYLAAVSFIDAQVGKLLDGLNQLHLSDNTVVLLWSDHGWKLGEHRGWCKQTNYEIDTRVPLIIRTPGDQVRDSSSDALVELVDLYPTLCDLAGIPHPPHLEGRSLAGLLAGNPDPDRSAAFSQFPRSLGSTHAMGYAMRTDRHRYVEWLDQGTGGIIARELYDHQTDPEENFNLAEKPEESALVLRLHARLWQTLPKPTFPHPALPASQRPSPSIPLSQLDWQVSETIPESLPKGVFHRISFFRPSGHPVELWWRDREGMEISWGLLKAGEKKHVRTRPGAVWVVRDPSGVKLGWFQVVPHPDQQAEARIPDH